MAELVDATLSKRVFLWVQLPSSPFDCFCFLKILNCKMLTALFVIVALFGIFFFYILRFFLAYLFPGILHYNYSYDLINFFCFSLKNRRIACLALTQYSNFAFPYSNIRTLHNFIPSTTILLIDNSPNYFSNYFKIHNFHPHNHRFFVLYTFNSEVKLVGTPLPVSDMGGMLRGYYFSSCNPKIFFIINSKVFLTNS